MTLPAKASRLGKVMGFNSSSGNPEMTDQVTGASVSVSGLSAGASPTASVTVTNGTAAFTLDPSWSYAARALTVLTVRKAQLVLKAQRARKAQRAIIPSL